MRFRILAAILCAATLISCGGGGGGSASQPPAPAVVTNYSVLPGSATVVQGTTQSFTAQANYSDGSHKAVSAKWSSSNGGVASIDPDSGMATALAADPNPVTISANIGGQVVSANLTVTARTVTQVIVDPGTATQPVGIAQQFRARAIWNDNSEQEVTSQAFWATDPSLVSMAGAPGLATGLAPTAGVQIHATYGGKTGSGMFTVSSAVLKSISSTPDSAWIPAGANQPFLAAGLYSDGSTREITTLVNWQSDSAAATVGLNSGLAVGVSPGVANISASYPGATGDTSVLNVLNAALVGIQLDQKTSTIGLNGQQQYTLTGTYTDGSTQDITASATWQSSDTGIAGISAGLATAVTPGAVTITASFDGFQDTATLNVTAAPLAELVITPALPSVGAGASVPFTATGRFNDGTIEDLTKVVTWTSSDARVAIIDASGVATTIGKGKSTIAAALGGISGSTTLTVTAATLQKILILPANFDMTQLSTPPAQPALTMPIHSTVQLMAVGYYSDHSYRSLVNVNWSSSKPSIAIITGSGVLRTKQKAQSAVITAKWNGNTATANLTVSSLQVSKLTIAPLNPTVAVGTGVQFSAQAVLSDGVTKQDVTNSVRWTTSNYQQAVVSKSGFASALSANTTPTITATFYNADGTTATASTTLTITSGTLTNYSVQPATGNGTIVLGTSQQFSATGTFSDGTTQDLTALTNWSSSDIGVAVMSNKLEGLAVSTGAGTASITGSFGGQTDSSQLTVTAP